MKKIVLIGILMLFVLSFSFEKNTALTYGDGADQSVGQEYLTCLQDDPWYIHDVIFDKNTMVTLEEKFYKKNIPEEYYDAFIYHTKSNPEIRLAFYSIMVHESVNFRYFINVNENGSRDIGPSQLNSSNLENKQFMNAYAPKDMTHINTLYCYYMVITINFFNDMYHKYGLNNALYIYNGGEKSIWILASKDKQVKAKYDKFIKNITAYNTCVNKRIQTNTERLNEFLTKEKSIYFKTVLLSSNPSYQIQLSRFDLDIKVVNIDKFINYQIDDVFTRQHLTNLLYDKELVVGYSIVRLFDKNV